MCFADDFTAESNEVTYSEVRTKVKKCKRKGVKHYEHFNLTISFSIKHNSTDQCMRYCVCCCQSLLAVCCLHGTQGPLNRSKMMQVMWIMSSICWWFTVWRSQWTSQETESLKADLWCKITNICHSLKQQVHIMSWQSVINDLNHIVRLLYIVT